MIRAIRSYANRNVESGRALCAVKRGSGRDVGGISGEGCNGSGSNIDLADILVIPVGDIERGAFGRDSFEIVEARRVADGVDVTEYYGSASGKLVNYPVAILILRTTVFSVTYRLVPSVVIP
jgi:hypothetical protein